MLIPWRLASRLWNALEESFNWPQSAHEDVERTLELCERGNVRAHNYDWIKSWYSASAVDRFAEEEARNGLTQFPSTEAVRERIRRDVQSVRSALEIGPPVGIIEAGDRTTRSAPGIPDGTYLTLTRPTDQDAWTFTKVNVADGYATLVPDDVPDGPVMLFEIQK